MVEAAKAKQTHDWDPIAKLIAVNASLHGGKPRAAYEFHPFREKPDLPEGYED